MDYLKISKEVIGPLYESYASLRKSSLNQGILALVELRVSQMNGCAYCCGLHSDEARKHGLEQKKLDVLPAWRTAKTSFTDEEHLALVWAEALTKNESSLELREQVARVYPEKELVDLTAAVSLMNGLNRIAMSLRE